MKEFEKIDYLPLGSIVILKGGIQKVAIIARGLVNMKIEPKGFFDYGGTLYPHGLVGDKILYFNHKDIAKIIFEGFSDDDDKMMVDNINEWYAKSDIERSDASSIRKKEFE